MQITEQTDRASGRSSQSVHRVSEKIDDGIPSTIRIVLTKQERARVKRDRRARGPKSQPRGSSLSLKGNSINENEIFDEKVSIHESMYKRSQCSRSSVIMKKKKDFSIV